LYHNRLVRHLTHLPGPTPPSYAARMDDDREAYEFAYALYLARQIDWEAAQMIVQAAEAGLIGIERATEAVRLLSGLQ